MRNSPSSARISVRAIVAVLLRTARSSSTTICISSLSLDRIARSRSISLQQLGQLVENLLPLEAGQPLQLHVEDRLRLDLAEAELRRSGRRAPRPGFLAARISAITASR